MTRWHACSGANARAEQGQWAKAIDEFEAAIKLDQGYNPEALYFIALAHLASGQDEEYRRTSARMLLEGSNRVRRSTVGRRRLLGRTRGGQ